MAETREVNPAALQAFLLAPTVMLLTEQVAKASIGACLDGIDDNKLARADARGDAAESSLEVFRKKSRLGSLEKGFLS